MKVVLVLALCAAAALAVAPIAIPKLQLPDIPGIDEPVIEASNGVVDLIVGLLNLFFGLGGGVVVEIGLIVSFVVEAILALVSQTVYTILSGLGNAVEIITRILNGEPINLPTDVDEVARGVACIVRELVEYIFVTGEGLADIVTRLLILILGDIGELLNVILEPILLLLESVLYNILPLTDIEGPIEILNEENVCASVSVPCSV